MEDTYKITPIHVGTITRKKSNMVYGDTDEPVDFPLLVFLLENRGRKILVDTGGSEPDGVHWMPYARKENENLVNALTKCGVKCDEIDAVIFTHLHWDHAGNNSLFRNAKLYVQKREYEYVAEAERPGFERNLVVTQEYVLIDGDIENLLPGISVILTPGHSVGSQCIIVDTEEGKAVLTGDTIPTYENVTKHTPNGGNYDLETITDSMNRIINLGLKIVPGHEFEVLRDEM